MFFGADHDRATVAGYTSSIRADLQSIALDGDAVVHNLTNNLGINAYADPAIYGNRAEAVVSQRAPLARR